MKLEITLDDNEKNIISNLKWNEKFHTKIAVFQNIQGVIIAVWIKDRLIGEFRKTKLKSHTPIILEHNE